MNLKNIGCAVVVAATAAAFVFGSVGISEAKAKKKPAAAPAMTMAPSNICIMPYGPVCAAKGKDGLKFTYNNSCSAIADGAKIVSKKACPPPNAMKAGKKKMAAKKPMKK
jgi:hypothetical protein